MTTKIAQRLTTMLAGQNMIEAARQIEAKCYDSARRDRLQEKSRKRLPRRPPGPGSLPTGDRTVGHGSREKQALARKTSRVDAAPKWLVAGRAIPPRGICCGSTARRKRRTTCGVGAMCQRLKLDRWATKLERGLRLENLDVKARVLG